MLDFAMWNGASVRGPPFVPAVLVVQEWKSHGVVARQAEG